MAPDWDARSLFPSDSAALQAAEDITADVASLIARCPQVFVGDPGQVGSRLAEIGNVRQRVQRLAAYGAVRFAVAVSDPAANDISSDIDAVAAVADDLFSMVVDEWEALDDEIAVIYLSAPELVAYRGSLMAARQYRTRRLAPEVARALEAREPLADAWADMYELVLGQVSVDIGDSPASVDQALSLARDGDRRIRHQAGVALGDALCGPADLLAHCYDTVIADRLVLDQMHGCRGPRELSDRANQMDPDQVDAALAAVASRWDVAQRWYADKAAALGSDVLPFADLMAPLGEPAPCTFEEARETVIAAFADTGEELARLARELFETSRVDARPRAGKMGNSCCVPAGATPAFVLTNFTGRTADVVTLGHEIGHALHFTMSGRTQPGLLNEPTLLVGEVAATFAELLVFEQLLKRADTAARRTAVAAARADTLVATVFRQTALTRFEQSAYAQRAAGDVLLADRLAQLWTASMRDLYGSAVAGYDHRDTDWALVPHFVRSRFYNSSYVLAALASLILYGADRAAAAYLELLRAGGSASTQEILRSLGVDGADPRCWHAGLDALEHLISMVG